MRRELGSDIDSLSLDAVAKLQIISDTVHKLRSKANR